MKIIGIDSEKCIQCEECVKDCSHHLYFTRDSSETTGEQFKIGFEDPDDRCILCGHCLAVCPTNAVITEGLEESYEFEEAKDPNKIINYENLMKMIRSRRSIRRFEEKPLPKAHIEKILQAMRYAPSASNAQDWNYVVITDPEKIQYLNSKVMRIFYLLKKVLKIKHLIRPIVSGEAKRLLLAPGTKVSVQQRIDSYEAGKDVIFFNAPCVVVLHSPKYGGMAGINAGIALTQGIFAAQSLGIGSCWCGFAIEAIQRFRKLRKWLIPKGRKCYGVVAFGYPAIQFHRAPERKELQVLYL
ncbi:MAG: nitroreductase family protein [Candidatus Helarchaeota archaeon]|nr:nitroreductase family protein [Candidatus Helarchaeota archaeon]